MKYKKFYFELLTRSWKIKRVTNMMVKLSFLHFRVTNLNLKNIKLHFELLTQSWLILVIQFYLCAVPLEGHQKKTSQFFWSPTKSNYLYIITSYCSEPLFSKLNLLITESLGLKMKFSIFVCRKYWLSNQLMVSLLN